MLLTGMGSLNKPFHRDLLHPPSSRHPVVACVSEKKGRKCFCATPNKHMFKETSVAALVKKFAPCASEPYAFCNIQHSRFSLSSLGCLRATPGRILLESSTIITAAARGQETDADGVLGRMAAFLWCPYGEILSIHTSV